MKYQLECPAFFIFKAHPYTNAYYLTFYKPTETCR